MNKSELVTNFIHLLKAINYMIYGQNTNHIIKGVLEGYPTITIDQSKPLIPLIFNVFDALSAAALNAKFVDPVDPTVFTHIYYAIVKFNIIATNTLNPFTLNDPLNNKVFEWLDSTFSIDQSCYTFPVLINKVAAVPPGVVFSAFFTGYLIKLK